jgi:hypothetical protein
MLWALLAILGVPIWLVVGGLSLALWNRHKVKQQPGVFPIKLRVDSGSVHGFDEKWKPMTFYALWVHDVLVVQKGLGLMRAYPLPVAAAEGEPDDVLHLEGQPYLLNFRLDDGAVIQMAAEGAARSLAQAPFDADAAPEQ